MIKVGYFTEWSVYRGNTKCLRELAIQGGYSHLIYAFAVFNADGELDFVDPYAAHDKGIMEDLRWCQQNGIKIGVSIGGWNHRHQFASFPALKICQSIEKFVGQYNFDFVDLDWEFESPDEASLHRKHLHDIILECKTSKMLALQCNMEILRALNLACIKDDVQHFILMAYNQSGPWSKTAQHFAGIDVSKQVIGFLEQDVPLQKLCLGVSGLGVSFCACKSIGATYESCKDIQMPSEGVEEVWDDQTATSVFHYKGNLISIESKKSLKVKLSYIENKALAGLAVWDIDAFSLIE